MDTVLQDLRYALRSLTKRPALATAIVLTIGLGLGAAAAIFMTSDAALVEPLPYAEPQRLVHLWRCARVPPSGARHRIPRSWTGDRVPRASAASRPTIPPTSPL